MYTKGVKKQYVHLLHVKQFQTLPLIDRWAGIADQSCRSLLFVHNPTQYISRYCTSKCIEMCLFD